MDKRNGNSRRLAGRTNTCMVMCMSMHVPVRLGRWITGPVELLQATLDEPEQEVSHLSIRVSIRNRLVFNQEYQYTKVPEC